MTQSKTKSEHQTSAALGSTTKIVPIRFGDLDVLEVANVQRPLPPRAPQPPFVPPG